MYALKKLARTTGLALLAIATFGVGSASALIVDMYHSPLDNGVGGAPVVAAPGAFTLNLWATTDADIYDYATVLLTATGSMSITSFAFDTSPAVPLGSAGTLGFGPTPAQYSFTWSNPGTGFLASTMTQIATVGILVGAGPGSLDITGGKGVLTDFSDEPIFAPPSINILTTVIPEPGTLLLLATGLTGLAVQGRRRG